MIIGVYGCGRFGNLWARIFSEKHEVVAVDSFKTEIFLGTQGQVLRLSPVEQLSRCEIIFICTPISVIETVVRNILPHISGACILADTCSVKEYPLRCLQEKLPKSNPIIGTHPLFGPDSYYRDTDLQVLLCRVRASDAEFTRFTTLLDSCSFTLHELSAVEHDKLMAHTQCITHLVGRILGEQSLPAEQHTTMGYRALLELVSQTGSDTEQLFYDMQLYNPYTATVRKQFLDTATAIIQLIDSEQKSILQIRDGKTKRS